jgi:hypothetical protein
MPPLSNNTESPGSNFCRLTLWIVSQAVEGDIPLFESFPLLLT